MDIPVEHVIREMGRRIDSLERAVSTPPPPDKGSSEREPKRGLRSFFDEKIVIAAIVSLVGVWATMYTNDKRLDQEKLDGERQLELETVKYQLAQYLEADDPEERVAVLHVIQDTPHTSDQMRRWAKTQYDAQYEALVRAQKLAATENAANLLKASKAERGDDAVLTAAEKRATEQAGERAVQELKQQVEGGLKTSKTSTRESARKLWAQGYEAFKKGDFDRAESLYLASRTTDANYAPAVNSLGNIALERREPALAEQQFREALKLDASYAPAAYNLALALANQKRTEEAKQQLQKAAVIQPNYANRAAVEKHIENRSAHVGVGLTGAGGR